MVTRPTQSYAISNITRPIQSHVISNVTRSNPASRNRAEYYLSQQYVHARKEWVGLCESRVTISHVFI